MERVAIYIRELNDEIASEKREALIRIAINRHWRCDLFNEEQKLGYTWPVKAKLLTKLRNHNYDGLLLFNLESWARNSTELILEFDEFTRKGLFIYSVLESLHLVSDFVDSRTIILCAFARFERSLIDKKRKIAIELAKNYGKRIGRPRGARDKVQRKTEGYFKREARKRLLKSHHPSST